MAVQYTPYAGEGRFGRAIAAKSTAKAGRARDEETLRGKRYHLSEFQQVHKNFEQAMLAKLQKEEINRKDVHDLDQKQKSEEAEWKLKKFKQKADEAEYHAQNVAGKGMQALSNMLGNLSPTAATFAIEQKKKRAEAESNEWHKIRNEVGATRKELRAYTEAKLTQEAFGTTTHALIAAKRDAGEITWSQYNVLIREGGGYGDAYRNYFLNDIANNIGSITSVNNDDLTVISTGEEVRAWDLLSGAKGTWGEISAAIAKDRRDLTEQLKGYDQSAIESSGAQQKIDSYFNRLTARAQLEYESRQKDIGEKNDSMAWRGKFLGGESIGNVTRDYFKQIGLLDKTSRVSARTNFFKQLSIAAGDGLVSSTQIDAIADQDITLAGGQRGKIGDLFRAEINNAMDMHDKHRTGELQSSILIKQEQKNKVNTVYLKLEEAILAAPIDQREAAVIRAQQILKGMPGGGQAKAKALIDLLEDPTDAAKNIVGQQTLADIQDRQGFLTEDDIKRNLFGSARITALAQHKKNKANDPGAAQRVKDVRASIKTKLADKLSFANAITGSLGDKAAPFALTKGVNMYIKHRQMLLDTQAGIGIPGAHAAAFKYVMDEIEKGFDGKGGVFNWKVDKNGQSGRFTNPYFTGYTHTLTRARAQTNIDNYKRLGLNMYSEVEIFTDTELTSIERSLTNKQLPDQHLMDLAHEVANYSGGKIAPMEVIRQQLERVGKKVPVNIQRAAQVQSTMSPKTLQSIQQIERALNNGDFNTAQIQRQAAITNHTPLASRFNSNIDPRVAALMNAGDRAIIHVGSTGRSSGPHIHIEYGSGDWTPNGVAFEDDDFFLNNILIDGKPIGDLLRGDHIGAGRGHMGLDLSEAGINNKPIFIKPGSGLKILSSDYTRNPGGYGINVVLYNPNEPDPNKRMVLIAHGHNDSIQLYQFGPQ